MGTNFQFKRLEGEKVNTFQSAISVLLGLFLFFFLRDSVAEATFVNEENYFLHCRNTGERVSFCGFPPRFGSVCCSNDFKHRKKQNNPPIAIKSHTVTWIVVLIKHRAPAQAQHG